MYSSPLRQLTVGVAPRPNRSVIQALTGIGTKRRRQRERDPRPAPKRRAPGLPVVRGSRMALSTAQLRQQRARATRPVSSWLGHSRLDIHRARGHGPNGPLIGQARWLSMVIVAAVTLLIAFWRPTMGGLQNPRAFEDGTYIRPRVVGPQVMIAEGHWFCVYLNLRGEVYLWDSLDDGMGLASRHEIISRVYGNRPIIRMECQRQSNANDCGVFALGFQDMLVRGLNPTRFDIDVTEMRNTVVMWLETGNVRDLPMPVVAVDRGEDGPSPFTERLQQLGVRQIMPPHQGPLNAMDAMDQAPQAMEDREREVAGSVGDSVSDASAPMGTDGLTVIVDSDSDVSESIPHLGSHSSGVEGEGYREVILSVDSAGDDSVTPPERERDVEEVHGHSGQEESSELSWEGEKGARKTNADKSRSISCWLATEAALMEDESSGSSSEGLVLTCSLDVAEEESSDDSEDESWLDVTLNDLAPACANHKPEPTRTNHRNQAVLLNATGLSKMCVRYFQEEKEHGCRFILRNSGSSYVDKSRPELGLKYTFRFQCNHYNHNTDCEVSLRSKDSHKKCGCPEAVCPRTFSLFYYEDSGVLESSDDPRPTTRPPSEASKTHDHVIPPQCEYSLSVFLEMYIQEYRYECPKDSVDRVIRIVEKELGIDKDDRNTRHHGIVRENLAQNWSREGQLRDGITYHARDSISLRLQSHAYLHSNPDDLYNIERDATNGLRVVISTRDLSDFAREQGNVVYLDATYAINCYQFAVYAKLYGDNLPISSPIQFLYL
ncbi:hypothetical protein KIPB_011059 [Kipferlia bialata]|uniref:Uncharacterized protein n=1 Tax=Kipferlia bialata TaxID=797122 RepID=A0A9K3GN16_9EUKA|nr:hypothetical protein KIPB_011059 [Kipferlia bialata]|eukprot:g11059.t1